MFPPVVEYRNVTYSPGGKQLLRSFNLTAAAGETLVLLGRSGAGKTTAMKLVNGLLMPTDGVVVVKGRPTIEWDPIELRRSIGYVIQEGGLFPHWTVQKNVALVPTLKGQGPESQDRARELLNRVGLPAEQFGGRMPHELSGGQRQRVGVARALAADPDLLLFDEPFGAVDPVTRAELQRLFIELRETLGKTSLFVTHDIREATILGNTIALLKDGALEWAGPAHDFSQADSAEARAFQSVLSVERLKA